MAFWALSSGEGGRNGKKMFPSRDQAYLKVTAVNGELEEEGYLVACLLVSK